MECLYIWMVKAQKFKQIAWLILCTMFFLIGTQVYRVFQNYQVNKQHFINDVQAALDLSVEEYYADLAKEDIMIMTLNEADSLRPSMTSSFSFTSKQSIDSTVRQITTRLDTSGKTGFSYTMNDQGTDVRLFGDLKDTLLTQSQHLVHLSFTDSAEANPERSQAISLFVKKVMVSISQEQLDIQKLSDRLRRELDRKELAIEFELSYQADGLQLVFNNKPTTYPLHTTSKSTYLSKEATLSLHFENASLIILRRGLVDIVLSLVIVGAVLGMLLYLYRVIRDQKQLAMIKDDLISNITHEFKTPIATIHSAIEGIAHFNESNDPEKTKRYLGISSDQLKKLNVMVEKLLETATIDSGALTILPEDCDLNILTQQVVTNYRLLGREKQLNLTRPSTPVWYKVDGFHMENALSNLLDNALKYGGPEIQISLLLENGRPCWQVEDNGGKIEKVHRDKIFEKLYRIPQGNRHEVKGFGIGLYYTRAIVEKHGGSLSLEVAPQKTIFTIRL